MMTATTRFSITGPDGIVYDNIRAGSPIEAVLILHREGLGAGAVRLVEGRLVFTDPEDARLCAGSYVVTAQGRNAGAVAVVKVEALAAA